MAGRDLVLAALAGLFLTSGEAAAAGKSLVPLPKGQAVSTHGPFEAGDCSACHLGKDAKPGKLRKAGNALCFECHEEYRSPVDNHTDDKGSCVGCHSPHNARKRKLLL